jgi:hypothetical protein
VLLQQAVEERPALLGALGLQDGLCHDGGPGQVLQVAQLETPAAVGEVLQAALAEDKTIR